MDPNQLRKIIKEELEPIIETLNGHTKTLESHSKILEGHSTILESHSEKLDSLTEELHHVHKLADATLDIVKGRYEKNKKKIDEIKTHLNMPINPPFGESP